MPVLEKSYFINYDTLWIAKNLLGKSIQVEKSDKEIISARITETEAYLGAADKASHAWNNRKTQRTKTMFKEGGIAYVYLCYGIHHLFNIVTSKENTPHAVLIRGVIPLAGKSSMEKIAGKKLPDILNGPGKFTKAMGIKTSDNGIDITTDRIKIIDSGFSFSEDQIKVTPRIGINYAGEDALLPYRFVVERPELI